MRFIHPLKSALLCTALVLGTLTPSVAETYDEGQQRQLQQERAQDITTASTCLTLSMVLKQTQPDAATPIYGEGGQERAEQQEAFWSAYLKRLGKPGFGVDENTIPQYVQMIEQNPVQAVPAFQPGWQQCSAAYDSLAADACPAGENDAPVSFYLPMNNVALAKVCREMAQMMSEAQPKQGLKDDPEAMAFFNTERQADIAERDFFDGLLAAQAVPQCPKGAGPFMGSTYAGPRAQVEKAYADWIQGLNTQDQMTSIQMPYIQWQTACGTLKDLSGYSAGE